MNGDPVGSPAFLGDQYFWISADRRELTRMGDVLVFKDLNLPSVYSSNGGESWREFGFVSKHLRPTSTHASIWFVDDTLTADSKDFGESLSAIFRIPSLREYEVKEFFCLDHHCYANTDAGLLSIATPTVSVDEGVLTETTIQTVGCDLPDGPVRIYNVLGEQIAVVQLVDGALAPYQMDALPMQPLWAVTEVCVKRVR